MPSVFRCEKKLSAMALSKALPVFPCDWTIPSFDNTSLNAPEEYCDPRSLLSRIRLNSDYAEVFIKPRNQSLASGGVAY